MKTLMWLMAIGSIAGIVVWFWKARERMRDRQQASEARFSAMMAEMRPATAPVVADASLPQQRLLLEAATKAAEAGEPALSIQLYARLLSRYPQTQFASQARAAVEGQKKKIASKA